MLSLLFNQPTAGTLFTQSIDGTLTSVGDLSNRAGKTLTGSLTPITGSVVKFTQTSKSGTLSSVTGSLVKQTQRALSGALATIAGALIKQTNKVLTGTLTTSGTIVKFIQHVLTGTLTTSGTLIKQTQRALSGTLTTAGALVKQTNKVLTGTLSFASGTLVAIKIALKSLTGTLSFTSGIVVKQTQRNLSGTLTTVGTIVKQTLKVLTGGLTTAGALIKRTSRFLTGTVTSAGALVSSKSILKSIAGTLSFASGIVVKQAQKTHLGTLSFASGTLIRSTLKQITAILSISGSLSKRTSRALAGALSFVGNFTGFIVVLFPPVTRATITGKKFLFNLLGIKSGVTVTGTQVSLILSGIKLSPTVTGKQGSYLLTNMANKVNIPDLPLGDDFIIALVFTNPNGTPFDLSGGGTASFAMKLHTFDTPFLIQKDSTGTFGGISITNAVGGLANLTLNAADSVGLAPGPYDYSAKAVSGSGKKNTQIIGVMTWIDSAGRTM